MCHRIGLFYIGLYPSRFKFYVRERVLALCAPVTFMYRYAHYTRNRPLLLLLDSDVLNFTVQVALHRHVSIMA